MSFKDSFLEDIDEVLFDEEELADYHQLDGRKILCVVTEQDMIDAKMSYGLMKSTLNPKEGGINKKSTTVWVKEKDAYRKFSADSRINFDGKNMFISDVRHDKGLYRLNIGYHGM